MIRTMRPYNAEQILVKSCNLTDDFGLYVHFTLIVCMLVVESSEGDAPDNLQSGTQRRASICLPTDWQGLSLY